MKIAVLVSGSGTNLQTLIEQLHKDETSGIEIAVVISDRQQAYALTRAKRAGIPTQIVRTQDFENRIAYDAEISRQIENYSVELIVLAGFMKLFQPPLVRKYRNRIINVHPSLLPAFPGATPVADSLAYGVKVAGVTVHFVDEDVDTGPIIAQTVVPVYDTDDEESLHKRIQIEEHKLYPKVIKSYAQGKLKVEGRKVIKITSET
ncbi:MAG: phosphoribosylglycinamide formyltransferase [Candidatus Poribacteria bacterium]|nr:phosphoribosylglycinamide formyltransferase [Candidatus Poribacteria bacterium]